MQTTDLDPDRHFLLNHLALDERIVRPHGHCRYDRHGLACLAAMRGAAPVENCTAVAS